MLYSAGTQPHSYYASPNVTYLTDNIAECENQTSSCNLFSLLAKVLTNSTIYCLPGTFKIADIQSPASSISGDRIISLVSMRSISPSDSIVDETILDFTDTRATWKSTGGTLTMRDIEIVNASEWIAAVNSIFYLEQVTFTGGFVAAQKGIISAQANCSIQIDQCAVRDVKGPGAVFDIQTNTEFEIIGEESHFTGNQAQIISAKSHRSISINGASFRNNTGPVLTMINATNSLVEINATEFLNNFVTSSQYLFTSIGGVTKLNTVVFSKNKGPSLLFQGGQVVATNLTIVQNDALTRTPKTRLWFSTAL